MSWQNPRLQFRPQYRPRQNLDGAGAQSSRIPDSPNNFSWLIVNEIAGCACPKSEEHMEWLQRQGIKHIVTVSKSDRPPAIAENSFSHLVIPLANFSAPSMEQLQKFTDYCRSARAKEQPLVVHCRFGRGRTGTFLACYLIAFHSMDASSAIRAVRQKRKGSIEMREQEDAIKKFEDHIKTVA